MWAAGRTLERCRCRRDVRQAEQCVVYPGQYQWNQSERNQNKQNRRTNPNSEPPVFRIMDRLMRIIEGNHTTFLSQACCLYWSKRFWARSHVADGTRICSDTVSS